MFRVAATGAVIGNASPLLRGIAQNGRLLRSARNTTRPCLFSTTVSTGGRRPVGRDYARTAQELLSLSSSSLDTKSSAARERQAEECVRFFSRPRSLDVDLARSLFS